MTDSFIFRQKSFYVFRSATKGKKKNGLCVHTKKMDDFEWKKKKFIIFYFLTAF